ncbi:MAG: MlaD family protein, partial [Myxococcota bacterium]|nr:MlaD family protein [Myxococcota bacterium]
MAVTRAQRVRLGIFLAVGGGLTLAALILLAGAKLGERRDEYRVRFSDPAVSLSGLDVGSPVKYSGIRVGRVESIRVDPQDVSVIEVLLSLDGGTPVAEDSVASPGSLGITGLKYIELSRGGAKARVRRPGEVIPAGASLIDELADQASSIARKVDLLADRLNTFTTPDMRERVATLLDRANRLLETAEATVAENRTGLSELTVRLGETATQLQTLSASLQRTAANVDGLVASSRPQVERLVGDSAALVGELRQTRGQLDGALADGRAALQEARQVVGPAGLGQTLASLDRLSTRGYLLLLQSQEQLAEALG